MEEVSNYIFCKLKFIEYSCEIIFMWKIGIFVFIVCGLI